MTIKIPILIRLLHIFKWFDRDPGDGQTHHAMKYLLILACFFCLKSFAQEPTCLVQVCTRVKRWSLDPFAHLKDHFGEVCYDINYPKSQSQVGRVLQEKSLWWQGNPTKEAVTTITRVYRCSQ